MGGDGGTVSVPAAPTRPRPSAAALSVPVVIGRTFPVASLPRRPRPHCPGDPSPSARVWLWPSVSFSASWGRVSLVRVVRPVPSLLGGDIPELRTLVQGLFSFGLRRPRLPGPGWQAACCEGRSRPWSLFLSSTWNPLSLEEAQRIILGPQGSGLRRFCVHLAVSSRPTCGTSRRRSPLLPPALRPLEPPPAAASLPFERPRADLIVEAPPSPPRPGLPARRQVFIPFSGAPPL